MVLHFVTGLSGVLLESQLMRCLDEAHIRDLATCFKKRSLGPEGK